MRHVATLLIVALSVGLSACKDTGPAIPPVIDKNSFKGVVKAEFLNPGTPADYYRDMRLLEPFGYVDPQGVSWDVPAGAITNGASVPWGFWNIVGGPYDGPYRDAAVIHDYYVEQKTRTWEDTHRMFYHASLARGVSDTLARTMYAGVRYGGPRWDVVAAPTPPAPAQAGAVGGPDRPAPAALRAAAGTAPAPAAAADAAEPLAPQPPDTKPLAPVEAPAAPVRSLGRSLASDAEVKNFDDLRLWIEREKPSLEEIDRKVESMRRSEGKPAVVTP